MKTTIVRVQNNVRATVQKFIKNVEESGMRLVTKNTMRSNWLTKNISIKAPAKIMAGLALGVLLTWTAVSPYSASADAPTEPLTDAKVQPVIQAEIEDGFGQLRSSFTGEELLVIQAEMEDGFGGIVKNSGKQVELQTSGVTPKVLQALLSHDVGTVFSAEEWLRILAEIEDTP